MCDKSDLRVCFAPAIMTQPLPTILFCVGLRLGLGMKSGVQSESRLAWAIAASMDPGVVVIGGGDVEDADGVTTAAALRGRPAPVFLRFRGRPHVGLPVLRVGMLRTGGPRTAGVVMAGRVTPWGVFTVVTPRDLLFSSVANLMP